MKKKQKQKKQKETKYIIHGAKQKSKQLSNCLELNYLKLVKHLMKG